MFAPSWGAVAVSYARCVSWRQLPRLIRAGAKREGWLRARLWRGGG